MSRQVFQERQFVSPPKLLLSQKYNISYVSFAKLRCLLSWSRCLDNRQYQQLRAMQTGELPPENRGHHRHHARQRKYALDFSHHQASGGCCIKVDGTQATRYRCVHGFFEIQRLFWWGCLEPCSPTLLVEGTLPAGNRREPKKTRSYWRAM